MKSIEVKLIVKGLAGINVDSTKANNEESAKALVRVVRSGKLCATSSLSRPLKASPTEQANAKVKRHVALWNDTEQSLVFVTARGSVVELQVCLRLQNGKEHQIGTGSLKLPVEGATDVKIREGRRNYSVPYRIDPSGDARLRMYATWEEKKAGKESTSNSTVEHSCVAFDHSCIEVSAVGKPSTRQPQIEALREPLLPLVRPDPPHCEEESLFEPSVEQVFVPKSHKQHNEPNNDVSGNTSKNRKKKSTLAKWMGWGRSKKTDDTPSKKVTTRSVQTSSKTIVSTAQVQKGMETLSKKTASATPVEKIRSTTPKKSLSAASVQNEPLTRPKKSAAVAIEENMQLTTPKKNAPVIPVPTEQLATPKTTFPIALEENKQFRTPKKASPVAQVDRELEATPKMTNSLIQLQNEQFTSLKKTLSVAQAEKELETTPKRTGAAQVQKESNTPSNKIKSIQQKEKEESKQTNIVLPEEVTKSSPKFDASDFSSAWQSPVFVPLNKEAPVVSPERSNSSVTTKTPSPAVWQEEQSRSSSFKPSPPQPFMFSTPRSDFRLRSKPDDRDGFEALDFSFPTPDFQRHTTPRMGSKRPTSHTTEIHGNIDDGTKGDALEQDQKPVFVSPEASPAAEHLRKDAETYASNQASPVSVSRIPPRAMDDYSLYSEDDSTFMAKPKQIFGLIKCCIMGDEDSIYGFDETLTFDETLGEETVNSYDDTLGSDLPMNDWWCGRPQAPAVLRRRQLWKERMQELAEKNANVKELFESESEAGSTCVDDDDDEATAKEEVSREKGGQELTTAGEKPMDSSNRDTLGPVPPPVMRVKINP